MATKEPEPTTSTKTPEAQEQAASTPAPTTSTPSSSNPPSSSASTSTSTAAQKAAHKPFPSITGSCLCTTIRYRLLTSPLFVYACHCTDCQKTSGSAFAIFANIETYNIALLSPTPPVLITQAKRPGLVNKHVECPKCKVQLWSNSFLGPGVADVRVGTLDFAGLFEPDMHSFVESKVGWLRLPEGARTAERDFSHRDAWPKSSLKRLEICLARVAAAEKSKNQRQLEEVVSAHVPGSVTVERPVVSMEPTPPPSSSSSHSSLSSVGLSSGEDGAGDGEKTPTAVDFGDEGDVDGESDEAFEKRYKETEAVLQARLEKLSLKLKEEEKRKEEDLERLTRNLDLSDGKDKEVGEKAGAEK